MKIYLDNNILSNLVGGIDRLTEADGIALQKISNTDHEFITSPLMEEEMQKARLQQIKGAILFLYKIFGGTKNLNPETYMATGWGDAAFGSVSWGGGEVENPVLTILHTAFDTKNDQNDARHLFQALSKKADFFLTFDERSILKKYRSNHNGVKDLFNNGGLKLVSPIELVQELGL